MLAVAILSAGKGTRMKSQLPKVLHQLGGKTLVERTIDSCSQVRVDRTLMIIGYQGETVKTALSSHASLEFVEQREQLGTGHAVQQLMPYLKEFQGDLLVLNGDVPLLRPQTIKNLLEIHQSQGNSATLLTAKLENPEGYGRVFCDENNLVKAIIEHRDCTLEQRENNRINAGVYCFNWGQLQAVLPRLSTNNDQKEYYLTEVFNYLQKVMALDVDDPEEINGINDRKQLADAYTILQNRIKDHWMSAGVTIIAPDTVTIDDTVIIAPDTIIEPQTHLRGNTRIGTGSRIGPGSLIENSIIGDYTTVFYSIIRDSEIKDQVQIGPYTHIRGHGMINSNCRLGNFVEIKNSTVGEKTNIAHLSYIGDAQLGEKVNIGAGTITANYDGVNKHKTVIGDRTKTGSNSVLVAPIVLGEDVTVGAGSVVTKDVEADCLVVARSKQIVKKGWRMKPKSN